MSTSNKTVTTGLDSKIDGTQCPELHCYLIHLEHLEPHEDDENPCDEGVFSSELLYVSAASKEEALAIQTEIFKAENYREANKCDWRSEFTQLTNDWDDLAIQVFSMNDPEFWQYACWDDEYFNVSLTKWAQENLALAECLYHAALAGNSAEHQLISEHQGLHSAYEKHQLSPMAQPRNSDQIQYRARAL